MVVDAPRGIFFVGTLLLIEHFASLAECIYLNALTRRHLGTEYTAPWCSATLPKLPSLN